MKTRLTLILLLLSALLAACGGETSVDVGSVATRASEAVDAVTGDDAADDTTPTDAPAPETPAEADTAVSLTGEEVSPTIDSAPLAAVDLMSATAAAVTADTDGYFQLQTMFLESQNKCLDGQGGPASGAGATLDGAAFMNDCQEADGQLWKLTLADNGYYVLQNKLGEGQNRCLESNKLADEYPLNGATYMDTCQNVTGQLWRLVEAGSGYYRMQSWFMQEENKCLEGNRLAPESVLQGASFMDNCLNVTGQLWKLVPAAAAAEAPLSTLTGQVVDIDSSEPLIGAQVCIQTTTQCATVDDNGRYTLNDLDPAELVFEVTASDYVTAVQTLTLAANETLTQDFALTATNPVLAVLPDEVVLRGVIIGIGFVGDLRQEGTVEIADTYRFQDSTWNENFPDYNVFRGDTTLGVIINLGSDGEIAVVVPNLSETELGKAANAVLKDATLSVTAVGEGNQPVKPGDLMEVVLPDPNSSSLPYTVNFYRGEGEARTLVATFTLNKQ